MKNIKNKKQKKSKFISLNDPNGSYTGTPLNPYEIPVQDADDL